MILCDRRSDAEWAHDNVMRFPRAWRARLLSSWRRNHRREPREANLSLLERIRTLADAERGGIPADASDNEICERAELAVRDMNARLELWVGLARRRSSAIGRWGDAFLERVKIFSARALLRARGLLDLWPASQTRRTALLRLAGVRFWRRVYRTLHARTVEACAIDLGLVRRTTGLYCSDDSLKRCIAQDKRNAAVLEQVTAVNDHDQAYTLAELAALGVANKAIRRMELLTRIAGFEHIAKETGHMGFMVTVTCPSRFHKATTRTDGRTFDNARYDGSLPDKAQAYLTRQWARARTAAARRGLVWYGFRIAEPQHDGTPHWHSLLFFAPVTKPVTTKRVRVMADGSVKTTITTTPGGERAVRVLQELIREHFLDNESPHEPGAQKHRVDFEAIDWTRGSAVGYVIKYVSKNIDGHGVGTDLFGNDAITSSQRVAAWARTWRIRQFQQVGGPPVGVWRELRRLHPDNVPAMAPESLRQAMSAINVGKVEPGAQALAWAKYTNAQGGIGTPRKLLRIKLLTEQTGELGAYGEAMAPRSLGVLAMGVEYFRNHIHVMRPEMPSFERPVTYRVESERAEWVIQTGGAEAVRAVAAARFALATQRSAEGASTRIHVNNCTQGENQRPRTVLDDIERDRATLEKSAPSGEFDSQARYLKKLRRWVERAAAQDPADISPANAGYPQKTNQF